MQSKKKLYYGWIITLLAGLTYFGSNGLLSISSGTRKFAKRITKRITERITRPATAALFLAKRFTTSRIRLSLE